MAVPHHCAGGETTIHAVFREMVSRGHSVEVICKPHSSEAKFDPYVYEGVKVVRPPDNLAHDHKWFCDYVKAYDPDLILTHLDLTFSAMQVALDTDKPLAHFVHNSDQLKHHRVSVHRCQMAIFNSDWLAREQEWKGPQVTVRPVVEPDRYRCKKGKKITLVNPTPGKGEATFYGLSRRMSDREFLVVKSVYGEQIFPPAIRAENFPNVEFMQHTADIREVFQKTGVVLMPSMYESYGRVAVEAACAGIPAIVHPTEGLLEALGADTPDWIVEFTRAKLKREQTPTPEQLKGGWVSGAGIFCDRDDLDSWQSQLERLNKDEVYYRSRVDAALKLAGSLNPQAEYDRLEASLMGVIQDWKLKDEVIKVKMWTSDSIIWELSDRRLIRGNDQRIPQDAIRQAAGVGTEIPEEIAIKHGLIADPNPKVEAVVEPEVKAIEAPAENKAIEQPEEKKKRKRA